MCVSLFLVTRPLSYPIQSICSRIHPSRQPLRRSVRSWSVRQLHHRSIGSARVALSTRRTGGGPSQTIPRQPLPPAIPFQWPRTASLGWHPIQVPDTHAHRNWRTENVSMPLRTKLLSAAQLQLSHALGMWPSLRVSKMRQKVQGRVVVPQAHDPVHDDGWWCVDTLDWPSSSQAAHILGPHYAHHKEDILKHFDMYLCKHSTVKVFE